MTTQLMLESNKIVLTNDIIIEYKDVEDNENLLDNELKKSHEYDDFFSSDDEISNLIYNRISLKMYDKKRTEISIRYNMVKDFCIRINDYIPQFDTNFREILNKYIKIEIGGQYIISMPLSLNLLFCKLSNNSIEEYDNSIVLPLFFSNMMKNEIFPIYKLIYHNVVIRMDDIPYDIDVMFDSYTQSLQSTEEMWDYPSKCLYGDIIDIPIITSSTYSHIMRDNYIDTYYWGRVKFLLFEFFHKDSTNNYFNYDESQPIIDSIEISVNGLEKMVLTNILTVNFLGIRYYMLPLSTEITGWDEIKDYFFNIDKKLVGNTAVNLNYDSVRIKFNTNIDLTTYTCIVTVPMLNIIRMGHGMAGLKFSS